MRKVNTDQELKYVGPIEYMYWYIVIVQYIIKNIYTHTTDIFKYKKNNILPGEKSIFFLSGTKVFLELNSKFIWIKLNKENS
jgi:hypothetical protein